MYKYSLIFKISLFPMIFALPVLQAYTLSDYSGYNDALNYLHGYRYIQVNGFSFSGNPHFGKGNEFLLDFIYYVFGVFMSANSVKDILIINGIIFSVTSIITIELIIKLLTKQQFINRSFYHSGTLLLYAVLPLGVSNQLARQSIMFGFIFILALIAMPRVLKLILPSLFASVSHLGSIFIHIPLLFFTALKQKYSYNIVKLSLVLVILVGVPLFLDDFLYNLTQNPVLRIRSDFFTRTSSNSVLLLLICLMMISRRNVSLVMILLTCCSISLAFFSQPIVYRALYGIEFTLIPLLFLNEASRLDNGRLIRACILIFSVLLILSKIALLFWRIV